MWSDGVGDGEDERIVVINECVSDGVVVAVVLVVGIGSLVAVLLLVIRLRLIAEIFWVFSDHD